MRQIFLVCIETRFVILLLRRCRILPRFCRNISRLFISDMLVLSVWKVTTLEGFAKESVTVLLPFSLLFSFFLHLCGIRYVSPGCCGMLWGFFRGLDDYLSVLKNVDHLPGAQTIRQRSRSSPSSPSFSILLSALLLPWPCWNVEFFFFFFVFL